jgi:hypothetical protein
MGISGLLGGRLVSDWDNFASVALGFAFAVGEPPFVGFAFEPTLVGVPTLVGAFFAGAFFALAFALALAFATGFAFGFAVVFAFVFVVFFVAMLILLKLVEYQAPKVHDTQCYLKSARHFFVYIFASTKSQIAPPIMSRYPE